MAYIEAGSSTRIPAYESREQFFHRYGIDIPIKTWHELILISRNIHKPISVIVRSALETWMNGYYQDEGSISVINNTTL